jgi:hypothetical protein
VEADILLNHRVHGKGLKQSAYAKRKLAEADESADVRAILTNRKKSYQFFSNKLVLQKIPIYKNS